ncbi:MAG: alpha/beta hydrolase [Cyanobacteria bacterium J06627_8]
MTVGSPFSESLPLLSPAGQQPGKPLFLFLPGMDGSGNLLGTQLSGLRQSADVRCATLPAYGSQSWQSLSEQTIGAIHNEHKQFGQRKVYLCGESFGACLALQVVMRAPELIDRLILVNSASAFREFQLAELAANIIKRLPDMSYPLACSILLPFLANLDRVESHNSQALLSAMQAVGYAVAAQRIELLNQFEILDKDYRAIVQPTLIISGGRDRLLPSDKEATRLGSLIPNASVHRLPYSGHTCLLERDIHLKSILAEHHFDLITTEELSSGLEELA